MESNIKGVILDVDGVIVGEKIGFNSPWPHPDVIKAMSKIKLSGVPISLCTAKPHFAIDKIIEDAGLNNVHITDGGGVIIDPIGKKVIKKNLIPTKTAVKAIKAFVDTGIYTEFYTVDNYFIQKSQAGKITTKHAHVIQGEPLKTQSLSKESEKQEVTKIMPIAVDENHKRRVEEVFKPFSNKLVLSWGVHPVILPLQFGIVTAPGISKKQGATEISKAFEVPFENMLGVGDSGSDWQFVEMCKYGAAMGNAKDEFKKLVKGKGENYSFIAPSVDNNGILQVFKHFGL